MLPLYRSWYCSIRAEVYRLLLQMWNHYHYLCHYLILPVNSVRCGSLRFVEALSACNTRVTSADVDVIPINNWVWGVLVVPKSFLVNKTIVWIAVIRPKKIQCIFSKFQLCCWRNFTSRSFITTARKKLNCSLRLACFTATTSRVPQIELLVAAAQSVGCQLPHSTLTHQGKRCVAL